MKSVKYAILLTYEDTDNLLQVLARVTPAAACYCPVILTAYVPHDIDLTAGSHKLAVDNTVQRIDFLAMASTFGSLYC
jgi:hypothetical protein